MSNDVRVLVLEDDEDMREMIATVLDGEGYRVKAVGRGAEAVQLAAQEPFDLVIADIRMEGMDGLEALQRVREHQPAVRSLVVTGYSTEDDSIRAIRLGVGDYLKKPFDFKEFLGSVRRLVGARRQEAARREMESRMRTSWLRSTEALARMLDGLGHPGRPPRGLMGAAELASRLARALGLESGDTARLAALMAGLGALEGVPFGPEPEELPAGLALVLRHLDERYDGLGGPDGLAGEQIPIESRIVTVALSDDRSPGRCDPRVLAALEDTAPPRPLNAAAHLRGLLSLGRALEEAGDRDGARQAYSELALARHVGAETVEAHLGLARVAPEPAEAAAQARRAAAQAAHASPGVAAQAYLRAGQLLRDPSLLSQAAHLAGQLREPGQEAMARLSARVLANVASEPWEPALDVLLAPEHAWELARAASWLLSFLLAHPGPSERALAQLARDVPREFERQLPSLQGEARLAAARALARAGGPEKLLAQLATDPDERVRAEVARAQQSGPPVLRIFSFGPMEVFRGEQRVTDKGWRSQKGRYLFAFLAAHRAQPVPEDQLIDAFWPEDANKGRRNLYWYCSTLRAGLRPEGRGEELDYILRSGGCLQLNPTLPRWHDLEEFEHATESGLKGDDALLRRAVSLHRGPFLEACYMDWTNPIRDRTTTRLQECLTRLLARATPQEALEHSQHLLQLDPCSQEAYEAALSAQLALNRPQAAVRLFERCRRTLAEELGLEPGLRLMELYQRARLSL